LLNNQENKNRIIELFPDLLNDPSFEIIDGPNPNYNCIAWAANIKDAWYQNLPHDKRPTFRFDGVKFDWPFDAPDEFSINSLTQIFTYLGYEECQNGTYIEGYKKVVFYQKDGVATHAARQLTFGKHKGKWTSKLGPFFCIVHGTPESIINNTYGEPIFFMKKNMN